LFTPPNLVTLFRLLLAPFVASAILNGSYRRAIVLFFVAGITDVIDGLLARRMDESTRVGAYLDPIADKILLGVIYVSLALVHDIPWWMVAVVFGRDVLILGMAAYGLLFTSIRKFPPSVWGKLSTFFQISAALVVMCARAGIPAPVKLALWLMLIATVWSGLHYAWRGMALLRYKTN
jgi:cardiolipin synthase (CMP-forming)